MPVRAQGWGPEVERGRCPNLGCFVSLGCGGSCDIFEDGRKALHRILQLLQALFSCLLAPVMRDRDTGLKCRIMGNFMGVSHYFLPRQDSSFVYEGPWELRC